MHPLENPWEKLERTRSRQDILREREKEKDREIGAFPTFLCWRHYILYYLFLKRYASASLYIFGVV